MSRIRSIKPEMWTSADFLSLSTSGQLMFIWLVSQADDEGRLKSSASHIERCLGVSDADDQLGVMEARGMAKRYQIGASDYIVLLNFRAHQRIDKPQPSRLPAPIVPKRSHKRRIPLPVRSENDPGMVAPRARAVDPQGSDPIDPTPLTPQGGVGLVWRAYLAATGLRRELTPSRRELLLRRCRTYPAETLEAAMYGHVHDPWSGRRDQREIEHLLKPTNVERFAGWHLDPSTRPGPSNDVDRQVLQLAAGGQRLEG